MKSARKSVAYRCLTVLVSALLVLTSVSATGCSFYSLIPNSVTPSEDGTKPENTTGTQDGGGTAGNISVNKPSGPVLPTYYNPLTGLASLTDMSLARPVAICIGNTDEALPQYGLGQADILIEAPVEGGITRLVMVTNSYSSLAQIGSVRATRSYLLSVSDAFGAVSVYAGTSDIGASTAYPAYDTLDYITQNLSTVFYRNTSLFAPHNLFTSGTRLLGAMENFEKTPGRVPYSFVPYGNTAKPSGGRASGVTIPFSGRQVSQFIYNEEENVYLRLQNATPHIDAESGEQISFTNLLLLICESSTYNKVTGTELDLNVTDGGRGYYVSGGTYTEIVWSRGESGELCFTDASGAPLAVNRGKTYVGLVDLTTSGSLLIV